jgi:Na+-driven multidrug efflux pump
MYLIVVQFIFYEKKTHLLSMVSIASALLHAGICYYFVQVYGAIGAAYATTVSYLISFLMTWVLSARVYKMPWLSAHR